MPHPAFHLKLASDLLDFWSTHPDSSPFSPFESKHRSAFLHGSLGPDLGFFPGSPRVLAELAHHGPTGDLTRELLAQARDAQQAAFAWGWATHVLADALIHPIVNRFAARLAQCSIHERALILPLHIRIEIGLDLHALIERPNLRRASLEPLFDRKDISFMVHAYERIHGVSFLSDILLAAHRRVPRFWGLLLTLHNTMLLAGSHPDHRAAPMVAQAARLGLDTLQLVVHWFSGETSESSSFLRPHTPCADFRRELTSGVAEFHRLFQRHVENRLATLPNYNLEDGSVVESSESAA